MTDVRRIADEIEAELGDEPHFANYTNYAKEGTAWELPVAFHHFDLPPFPLESLPEWMRRFVKAVATATQTPPDLAAFLAIGAESTAVGGKVEIEGGPGYTEPLNLFVVVALPPGNRKSAVFAEASAPILEFESERAGECKVEIARKLSEKQILEKRHARAQDEASKAPPSEQAAAKEAAVAIATELADFRVPASPRWLADDATQESVTSLLHEQGGRLGIMSPEGDLFDIMSGRYTSNGGVNLGVYLKGHAGDPIKVDRKGRPPEHIRRPALSIALAVQPDVMRGLVGRPGFRGRGLLGRFLYAMPESLLGRRDVTAAPVPVDVRETYTTHLRVLLKLPEARSPDGQLVAHRLKLSAGAREELEDLQRWVEPQLAPGGTLSGITDWAGKLAGAVVRLAGLFHLAWHTEHHRPWELDVDRDTMRSARRLTEYLIAHARAAFAEMGGDPDVESAKHMLQWIQRTEVTEFSKRDLFEGTKGRFARVSALDPGVRLLVEHGYIRERPTEPRTGPGRPPSPIYEVNPGSRNSLNSLNG